SKPYSHYLYTVEDCKSIEKFTNPEDKKSMVIELRGNCHYTVFPGSVHESNEAIEFIDPNATPVNASWTDLKSAVSKIAISTLLFKKWNDGIRHQLALTVSAVLARQGWTEDEVAFLIEAVADAAHDRQDHATTVSTTFKKYANDEAITSDEDLRHI